MRADDLPADLGRFGVVTFASSFHWMDRHTVAAAAREMLEPAGVLVQTGETYLAGPDHLMRSVSRLVLEDPDEYERAAVSAGLDLASAAFAKQVKGTILLQPVGTEAVDRALKGEAGTMVGLTDVED